MGYQMINLKGKKFGRWTVIEKARKKSHWWCMCVCGNIRMVWSMNLRRGASKSCGCYKDELSRNRKLVHGKSKTREYRAWQEMKSRCYNPKNSGYYLYGARGIKVCDEWRLNFESFLKSMRHCPKGYSLGRIDNDGNYEPINCQWEDSHNQSRNKRTNKQITYQNETMTQTDWIKRLSISASQFMYRLRKGQTAIEIIEECLICQ